MDKIEKAGAKKRSVKRGRVCVSIDLVLRKEFEAILKKKNLVKSYVVEAMISSWMKKADKK